MQWEKCIHDHEVDNISKDLWKNYNKDPLTTWSSRSLCLFDSPSALYDNDNCKLDYAVCSVPFDSTASTRIGARYGPTAIRCASMSYAELYQTAEIELYFAGLNQRVTKKAVKIRDYGDLHVYPTDIPKQMRATAAEIHKITNEVHCPLIILGGEHTISIASYQGVSHAYPDKVVGYVHIDHHFDFGDYSLLHGPYFHGSVSRRIIESMDCYSSSQIPVGFWGMGDLTSNSRLHELVNKGAVLQTMCDIRKRGVDVSLRSLLDDVCARCDCLYVSIDVDVCDHSCLTGTGAVTIGGLSFYDLLTVSSVLKGYPIIAMDIVEVSPKMDMNETTPMLVARFLYDYLCLA